MIDPQALILIQVICIITGTAGLAWGLMAYPLKIAPKASAFYALANFCVVTGIILVTFRGEYSNIVVWNGADLIVLTGFYLLRLATQKLFKLQVTIKTDVVLLAISFVAGLFFPPLESSNYALGIIFSLSAITAFSLLSLDLFHCARKVTSYFGAIFLIFPIASLTCVFIYRAGHLLLNEEGIAPFISVTTHAALPMLWFYMLLALLVNCSMIGCAITYLIFKVRKLADTDPLTELYNRRATLRLINSYTVKHPQDEYGLLLLDLDFFKLINDEFGHDAGDKALLTTANVLKANLAKKDIACRFGGEEFLVFLPNKSQSQTEYFATKLIENLRLAEVKYNSHVFNLTASCGVCHVAVPTTIEQALKQADIAMYRAKASGRNCLCFAKDNHNANISSPLAASSKVD
ncbi:diguanylate cyclase [Pseudoalteromonas tunicata]|uniref:GGDEF domain-containing protein n=1 Tax=Pseudoalteromonas tunicata TaxID=314281 RepID=UPI00273D33E8|nr:diguanylate cyclase [Pseudoalteromonas tunicata]MDP5213445.1 diguanylate cyclase [Pseudoalteromonas tunicata]